uniref:RING-type E3 ubiquitin transferase n=2 Tax=Nicotiana TaxID=4085 RepID=A0A1S4D8W0_TOBAC|nr:PREDICTED: E3 ubiquitin-protein ligase RNF13-like [Nicotiana sylvestris]XP_016509821.1 PREDICTED: E3 ubiquitin-protein ligase RNF13-like [Nicotiana tabacum]
MFEYWEITTYSDPAMYADDVEERAACFICCYEFQNGDILVTLPCNDVFHLNCFNERLMRRNDCPFCSAEVLPTHVVVLEEEEEEEEEEFEDQEIVEEQEEKFEVETRTYRAPAMDIDDDEEQETCAICLCEYEDEDTIGTLQCGHEFHVGCVN